MNLPNEIINYIFRYMSSPTAQLIKDEYEEYLKTYDKEYDEFYYTFSENYFSNVPNMVTFKFYHPISYEDIQENYGRMPNAINLSFNEDMNVDGIYIIIKDKRPWHYLYLRNDVFFDDYLRWDSKKYI